MYSTVNAGKVGFSKGARVLVGPVNAAIGDCTPVGLLGADATLSVEVTYRQKMDHFPEVEVASALATLAITGNFVMREWTKQNLIYALGLANSEATDVAASPVNVVDAEYTPTDGVVVIPHATPTSVVVKNTDETPDTLVLNTDYQLNVLNGLTHIVRVDASTDWASDTAPITVSYTYTPAAHTILPLGKAGARNYYGIWIEEGFTMSGTAKVQFQIYKASIGIDGAFNINSAENGADLPVVIQGSLDPNNTELGNLINYE